MYTTENFKSKKALREAVQRGEKVGVFAPGLGTPKRDGVETVEGPHYPEPHRWYARVQMTDGIITRVVLVKTWQDAVLDGIEDVANIASGTFGHANLRVLVRKPFVNCGEVFVLDGWKQVVRVRFDFQDKRTTLGINHDGGMFGGPASDTMFHLDPGDERETERFFAAWRDRIYTYQRSAL